MEELLDSKLEDQMGLGALVSQVKLNGSAMVKFRFPAVSFAQVTFHSQNPGLAWQSH